MGSTAGNDGSGDVSASTDPYGKSTMSKGYQDRESVPDRDRSLDTQNQYGTPYSPDLAEAITKANEEHAQARADRALGLSLQSMQANAIANTPGLSMSDYSPSNIGGVNPTAGLSLGQSLGYTGGQIANAIGNMNASAVGLGLLGLGLGIPGLGVLGYGFGSQDEDAPSLSEVFGNSVSTFGGTTEEGEVDDVGITDLGVNEFGNETFSMPAPSGIMGFVDNMFGMNNPNVTPIGMDTPVGTGSTTEQAEQDFADRMANQGGNASGFGLGSLFGPAPDMGSNQGGNRPLVPAENIDLDIDPVEEEIIDNQVFAYNPTYSPFQFKPNTNTFGFTS